MLGPIVRLLGAEVFLSVEFLKAAGLIGAIGGMQFLVTALVDKDYQREFFGEVRSELRQVLPYARSTLTSWDGPKPPRSVVSRVHDSVAAPARDHPPVDRQRDKEGHT
ncbi:MAG: hypothetical protein ACR2JG_01540 [Geodermatophilaceae bacterium]